MRLAAVFLVPCGVLFAVRSWAWWRYVVGYNRWVSARLRGLVGRFSDDNRVRSESVTRWSGTVLLGAAAAYMVIAGIVLLVAG